MRASTASPVVGSCRLGLERVLEQGARSEHERVGAGRPGDLHRCRQAVLGRAAGQCERRRAEHVEGPGQQRQPAAELALVLAGLRGDEGQRRGDEQVDLVEELAICARYASRARSPASYSESVTARQSSIFAATFAP